MCEQAQVTGCNTHCRVSPAEPIPFPSSCWKPLPWEAFFQLLDKKAPRQKRLFKYLFLTRDLALSAEGQTPGRGVESRSRLCHCYSRDKGGFPCCLHSSIQCSCFCGKCFTGWMTDMTSLLKSLLSDVALYLLF